MKSKKTNAPAEEARFTTSDLISPEDTGDGSPTASVPDSPAVDARVPDGVFWLRIHRPGTDPLRYELPALGAGQTLRGLTIVVPDPR